MSCIIAAKKLYVTLLSDEKTNVVNEGTDAQEKTPMIPKRSRTIQATGISECAPFTQSSVAEHEPSLTSIDSNSPHQISSLSSGKALNESPSDLCLTQQVIQLDKIDSSEVNPSDIPSEKHGDNKESEYDNKNVESISKIAEANQSDNDVKKEDSIDERSIVTLHVDNVNLFQIKEDESEKQQFEVECENQLTDSKESKEGDSDNRKIEVLKEVSNKPEELSNENNYFPEETEILPNENEIDTIHEDVIKGNQEKMRGGIEDPGTDESIENQGSFALKKSTSAMKMPSVKKTRAPLPPNFDSPCDDPFSRQTNNISKDDEVDNGETDIIADLPVTNEVDETDNEGKILYRSPGYPSLSSLYDKESSDKVIEEKSVFPSSRIRKYQFEDEDPSQIREKKSFDTLPSRYGEEHRSIFYASEETNEARSNDTGRTSEGLRPREEYLSSSATSSSSRCPHCTIHTWLPHSPGCKNKK